MSRKTVRIQIESPLADVKRRIDEIHAVIDKHSYITPMIEGGARRAILADSIMNAERINKIVSASVMGKEERELPCLPATNPRETGTTRKPEPPSSLLRAEAKIALTLEQQARERLERRKFFHRNCVKDSQVESRTQTRSLPLLRHEPVNLSNESPRDSLHTSAAGISSLGLKLGLPSESPSSSQSRHSVGPKPGLPPASPYCSQSRPSVKSVQTLQPVEILGKSPSPRAQSSPIKLVSISPPAKRQEIQVNDGPASLEELIAETQALLEREGGIADDQVWADQDIVAEIERDIEELSRDVLTERNRIKSPLLKKK
jgi:hypothetical protein